MRANVVVVSGTGTEIGKTHLTEALTRRWGRTASVAALKPIESGIGGAEPSDSARLGAVATFHVKQPPPYALPDPVSPHLAARRAGLEIRLEPILAWVSAARDQADVVLVELAGALFSPVSPTLLNIDLALALAPCRVLLVAADRLGVLHDVLAATAAGAARGLRFDAAALVTAPHADASTSSNVVELARFTSVPIVSVPRSPVDQLADDPSTASLIALLSPQPDRAPA